MVAFPTTHAADKNADCAYLSVKVEGKQFNLVSSAGTSIKDLPGDVRDQILAVAFVETMRSNVHVAYEVKTLDTITINAVPYETHSIILLTAVESVILLHKKYPDAKWFKCWTIHRDFAVITPQYDDQPDLSHAKQFIR